MGWESSFGLISVSSPAGFNPSFLLDGLGIEKGIILEDEAIEFQS